MSEEEKSREWVKEDVKSCESSGQDTLKGTTAGSDSTPSQQNIKSDDEKPFEPSFKQNLDMQIVAYYPDKILVAKDDLKWLIAELRACSEWYEENSKKFKEIVKRYDI